MRVPEIMRADAEGHPRAAECRLPDVLAEPVAGDMTVGVDRPRLARRVLALGTAACAVNGGGVLAMAAPALPGVVAAHGSVPILAIGSVGLGEPQARRVRQSPEAGHGGLGTTHREQQVIAAEA